MKTYLLPSFRMLFLLSILTGVLYPPIVTMFGNIFFANKVRGSFVETKGKTIGSTLIGQKFQSERYFWSRPSAIDYNPMPSGASNLGPTSRALKEIVEQRRLEFTSKNSLAPNTDVPAEMLYASASGIDPHISPEAALLQVQRVSKARGFTDEQKGQLTQLVTTKIENRQLGLFGMKRVNVLQLNIALDDFK